MDVHAMAGARRRARWFCLCAGLAACDGSGSEAGDAAAPTGGFRDVGGSGANAGESGGAGASNAGGSGDAAAGRGGTGGAGTEADSGAASGGGGGGQGADAGSPPAPPVCHRLPDHSLGEDLTAALPGSATLDVPRACRLSLSVAAIDAPDTCQGVFLSARACGAEVPLAETTLGRLDDVFTGPGVVEVDIGDPRHNVGDCTHARFTLGSEAVCDCDAYVQPAEREATTAPLLESGDFFETLSCGPATVHRRLETHPGCTLSVISAGPLAAVVATDAGGAELPAAGDPEAADPDAQDDAFLREFGVIAGGPVTLAITPQPNPLPFEIGVVERCAALDCALPEPPAPLADDTRVEGRLCAGAANRHAVAVPGECRLDVTVFGEVGGLTLHAPDGATVAEADRHLVRTVYLADAYTVEVRARPDGGEASYALATRLTCPPPVDCEAIRADVVSRQGALPAGWVCGTSVTALDVAVPRGCGAEGLVQVEDAERSGSVRLEVEGGEVLAEAPLVAGRVRVLATSADADRVTLAVHQTTGSPTTLTLQMWPACGDGRLVINEVEYDTPGADRGDYFEIFNAGDTPADLRGKLAYDVKTYEGARWINATYDLSTVGDLLVPGGFIIVGNESLIPHLPPGTLSISVPDGTIRNGPEFGFQLVERQTPGGGVHEVERVLDAVTWTGVVPGVTEGTPLPADVEAEALSRCPDGADTDDNGADFTVRARTPGAVNACDPEP